jgi:hypothetical protein
LEGLTPMEVVEEGSGLLWLAADSQGDYALYRSAFDRASGETGHLTKLLPLPVGIAGESLVVHNGRVYVAGTASPSGKVVSVSLSELG